MPVPSARGRPSTLRRPRLPALESAELPKAPRRETRTSFRWVEGLRDCAPAAERLPETRVVCTMDREADFLDLFIERRANAPQVDLLVRANVDRVLGKEQTPDGQTVSRRLFDQVRNAPARGAAKVAVQRLNARATASKQAHKDRRAERVADLTLRYQQVALPCPAVDTSIAAVDRRARLTRSGTAPVELWVVHARKEQPPPAVEPLEWFVLGAARPRFLPCAMLHKWQGGSPSLLQDAPGGSSPVRPRALGRLHRSLKQSPDTKRHEHPQRTGSC